MKIQDLSNNDIENIIDQFEDAKYLKLKGRKLINDIMTKYNLNRYQIRDIVQKNKIRLMRRYDGNQISQE